MRATEFIAEIKRGKQLAAQVAVSPGAAFTLDGFQDLYRASAIMGRCPEDSFDIDPYSYVTNRPVIVTYTDEEKKMVKQAFKRMGINYEEHASSGSKEPDGINKQSLVIGFKGY